MLAVTDTAIAAQNAVVAESFGIGSCYIGDIMKIMRNKRLLNLHDYVFQLLCWCLGFSPPSSKRIALNPRDVHRNILSMRIPTAVWTTLERNVDSIKIPPLELVQSLHQRKYNSDFSKETARSVGEYLKQFE